MQEYLEQLAQAMRAELEAIPPQMLQEPVARQVIISLLYQAVKQMGLIPLPSWKPPRSTRDHIDLVGVEPGSDPPKIKAAFVVDPLVELPKVKALEWVFCDHKVVVTYSQRADKVSQSTFFLAPGLVHINLYPAS